MNAVAEQSTALQKYLLILHLKDKLWGGGGVQDIWILDTYDNKPSQMSTTHLHRLCRDQSFVVIYGVIVVIGNGAYIFC